MRKDAICQFCYVFRQWLCKTFRSWHLRVCHEHHPQAQRLVCTPVGQFAENPNSRLTCVPRVKKRGILQSHCIETIDSEQDVMTARLTPDCSIVMSRTPGVWEVESRPCVEDACTRQYKVG